MAVEAREDYGSHLLRRVAEGDAGALVRLFELHGAAVWTFALRVCGDTAAAREVTTRAFEEVGGEWPDALSALLAAASRAAGRAAAEPAAAGRGVMPFVSLQERVRDCSLRLPTRQREVLALRALTGISYEEMAAIMDLNRAGVAQLIARARLTLAEEMRGTPLAERATARPECGRAVPLLTMRMDGQLPPGAEREWLETHVAGCQSCQATRRALHEADLSYRAWLPSEAPGTVRAAVTGVAGEAPAGRRFERTRYAPAPPRSRRWPRRLGSLTILLLVLGALAAFGVELFRTNKIAVPEPTRVTESGASIVPTPEPFAPEVRAGESDDFHVSETAAETIANRARAVKRREARLARRERRLRRLERRRAAERRREARQRAQVQRRRAERERQDTPARPERERKPAPVIGEAVEEDAQPSPEPSPSATPPPSGSADPDADAGG